LDLSEVGVGVEISKLILDKAAQAGKAVVERCAKVIELVNINTALTAGIGGLRFDAPLFYTST